MVFDSIWDVSLSIWKPDEILLANGTRLLREVIKRVIEKSSGLEIVGEVVEVINLSSTVEKTNPDWIVYFHSPGRNLPAIIEKIMLKAPTVRVLGISTDGGHVKMEWIGLREKQMDDSSLEELTDLLRSNLLNGTGNE